MWGVDAAGLVNHLPLSTDGSGTRFTVERRVIRPEDVPTASYRVVSPAYFTTLRARLLRGRYFSPSDRPESPPVFIINEVMAARYWPGEDPVGSRIRRGGTDSKMPYTTIVGVVADMKQQGLDRQATPEIYIPHTQFPWPEMNLLLRTSRTVEDVAPDLRATLRRLSGGPSVQAVRAFEDVLWRTLNARAFAANLLVVCTGLALTLAMLGVYAVTAHATAAQTKEIAIRVALGASASSVLHVAIGGTMRVVCLALALGSVGAYGRRTRHVERVVRHRAVQSPHLRCRHIRTRRHGRDGRRGAGTEVAPRRSARLASNGVAPAPPRRQHRVNRLRARVVISAGR